MRSWIPYLMILAVVATAIPASALNSGTDVLVPAAARGAGAAGSTWITDLYIFNPGTQSVSVTLSWLVRGQANTNPAGETLTVLSGETLVLEDVVFETFEMESGNGAFRVVADGEIVVNSRIYNLKEGVTFGQGFAGVPRAAALANGDTTDVVGLTNNTSFRSNIVLIDASGSGATVELSLRSTSDTELATGTYTLGAYEPRLFGVGFLDGVTDFDNATLHAEVTSGSAIVVASKIDNDEATGDPTTLDMWTPLGSGGSVDGTYQVSIYDIFNYAGGGQLDVTGGEVVSMAATYMNWEKDEDQDGEADCELLFTLGGELTQGVTLEDFATGVSWTESYPQSGQITYTVQFTVSGNMSISGTVDAVGANFPSTPFDDTGCNGTYPTKDLYGGKSN